MALVTTSAAAESRRFDLSNILEPGPTVVRGQVGAGKTFLATQAIGHALSDGKRVLLFARYGECPVPQALAGQFEQISDDEAFCNRLTYMNPSDHADVIVVDPYEALSERTQERLQALMRVCRSYGLAVVVLGDPSMRLPECARQVLVGRCRRESLPRPDMFTRGKGGIVGADRSLIVLDRDGRHTYDPLD